VTSGTRLMGSWTVLDETAVELTETTIKGSKHGTRRRAWGVSMCFFSDHFGDSSFGLLDLIRLRAAGAVCRCKSTQPIEANPALESRRPPALAFFGGIGNCPRTAFAIRWDQTCIECCLPQVLPWICELSLCTFRHTAYWPPGTNLSFMLIFELEGAGYCFWLHIRKWLEGTA
jgi:hypothetical protein